jgi:hypothetical protein
MNPKKLWTRLKQKNPRATEKPKSIFPEESFSSGTKTVNCFNTMHVSAKEIPAKEIPEAGKGQLSARITIEGDIFRVPSRKVRLISPEEQQKKQEREGILCCIIFAFVHSPMQPLLQLVSCPPSLLLLSDVVCLYIIA